MWKFTRKMGIQQPRRGISIAQGKKKKIGPGGGAISDKNGDSQLFRLGFDAVTGECQSLGFPAEDGDDWKKFDIPSWEKVIIPTPDRTSMVRDRTDFSNMYADEADLDGGISHHVEVIVAILL